MLSRSPQLTTHCNPSKRAISQALRLVDLFLFANIPGIPENSMPFRMQPLFAPSTSAKLAMGKGQIVKKNALNVGLELPFLRRAVTRSMSSNGETWLRRPGTTEL
ncbi:hypothetical protein ACVDG8_002150 [Mesorhizobium sp. ORM8.1]